MLSLCNYVFSCILGLSSWRSFIDEFGSSVFNFIKNGEKDDTLNLGTPG